MEEIELVRRPIGELERDFAELLASRLPCAIDLVRRAESGMRKRPQD